MRNSSPSEKMKSKAPSQSYSRNSRKCGVLKRISKGTSLESNHIIKSKYTIRETEIISQLEL